MDHMMMVFLLVGLGALPVVSFHVHQRIRMERRARMLLATHPGAERTSVYVPLHSAWSRGKRREMAAKIAEMQTCGWTFLRAAEASPLRSIRSWGGGVTLQFIKGPAARPS